MIRIKLLPIVSGIALAVLWAPSLSHAGWVLPICDKVFPESMGLGGNHEQRSKRSVLCLSNEGTVVKRVFVYVPESTERWQFKDSNLNRMDKVRAFFRTNRGAALIVGAVVVTGIVAGGAYLVADLRALESEVEGGSELMNVSEYLGGADVETDYMAERASFLRAARERRAASLAETKAGYEAERDSLIEGARERRLSSANSASAAFNLLKAEDLLIPYETGELHFYGARISAARVPKGVSRYMDGKTGKSFIIQHRCGQDGNAIVRLPGFEAIQIDRSPQVNVVPTYYGKSWTEDMYMLLADPWELTKMKSAS